MSPQSSRNGRRRQNKGAKAPEFTPADISKAFSATADALERMSKRVAEVEAWAGPGPGLRQPPSVGDHESPLLRQSIAASANALAPTIKPRLSDLIDLAQALNSRLDGLSNIISGDGNPATGTNSDREAVRPYAIPDSLSLLEDLLRRANDRTSSIFDRF